MVGGCGGGSLGLIAAWEPSGQGWAHPPHEAPDSRPTCPEWSPWEGYLVAGAVVEAAGHRIFSWNCSDGASLGPSPAVIYHPKPGAVVPALPLICCGTRPRCGPGEKQQLLGSLLRSGGAACRRGGRGRVCAPDSRQAGPRRGPPLGQAAFWRGC